MGLTGCCAACPEAARLSATAVRQTATSWIFACREPEDNVCTKPNLMLSGNVTSESQNAARRTVMKA